MTRRLALSLAAVLVVSPLSAEDAPRAPREAPQHMQLPEGFQISLFAGEPDVVQPIACAIDGQGRLWVVECLSYPAWNREGGEGSDRVVIFDDVDGDGQFDHRTVFWDKGTNLTGIELGFGGVWLCSTPNLLFVPDRDGDDKPDAPPQVVLDGWDLNARHNVFNGLIWGPDGWLYGCNGILSNSKIGAPGTPDDRRVEMNCGVWRYHPTRKTCEAVAHGTTNPWGLDFDDRGQMFITNCVIEHVFHVIPGAHYKRMFGQDIEPNSYQLIESCADHIHWGGGHWTDSRGGKGEHDKPGGGHAHAGAMIYLGDNFPDEYRNSLFTCNIHGNRVNRDVLKRRGSGYVAEHARDFLMVDDTWFRGLEVISGPDGGVYVTDWSDTGECHDYEDIHRENGRIYKISYGETPSVHVNIARLNDEELVLLLTRKNEWYVRQARLELQERAAAKKLAEGTRPALRKLLTAKDEPTLRLRAAWALHVTGGLAEDEILTLLQDEDPDVRGWAIQLELEDGAVSPRLLERFEALAAMDPSPIVRLFLASALQRLPISDRWRIAESLVAHEEDADDANLPLMIWYGIEPLIEADGTRAVRLLAKSELPVIRQHIARRIAARVK